MSVLLQKSLDNFMDGIPRWFLDWHHWRQAALIMKSNCHFQTNLWAGEEHRSKLSMTISPFISSLRPSSRCDQLSDVVNWLVKLCFCATIIYWAFVLCQTLKQAWEMQAKQEQNMHEQIFAMNRASLVAQLVKNPPAVRETWIRSLGWEDPLGKEKATLSSILAWRIPRMGRKESDMTEWLWLSSSVQ